MVKNTFILFCLLIVGVVISCSKKDGSAGCFQKPGNNIEELRSLQNFNAIVLKNDINLILIKDTINQLLLKAPKNLMKGISSEIKNGALILQNNNGCEFTRSYDFSIDAVLRYQSLDSIYFDGYGNLISSDTINQNQFVIEVWGSAGSVNLIVNVQTLKAKLQLGSADVALSGMASVSYVYSGNYGWIDLENLNTNICYLTHRAYGDVILNVVELLDGNQSSTGNIQLVTKPKMVKINQTGLGQIIYR